MPAYNFKKEFAEDVRTGKKRQTIRPLRKRPTRVGDTLYHYTGMRTKKCEQLKVAKCEKVYPIEIKEEGIIIKGINKTDFDLLYLMASHRNEQAKKDGFKNWESMKAFFKKQYGLPFVGVLIKW